MIDPTTNNLTFEQALAELEQIVRELEDGKTGLEEALTRYEQGVGLLRRCFGQLQKAEQRIVELLGIDGDGQVLSKPFEHTSRLESANSSAKG